MGLFDLLTFGLLGLENAKTRADDLKVSTTNFQQNNQCDLYFYHAETYHSLFYAEACSAGGYWLLWNLVSYEWLLGHSLSVSENCCI